MRHQEIARISLVAVAILSLQACNAEPTGQVVAVVNGEEITQMELNAEISELRVPPSGNKDAIRQQVLQQIIDRRLMAQVAKEEGFDRNPEFLTRERRLKEELLVQMYGKKAADTVRIPDAPTVKKYLADNPGKFTERAVYMVDQVVFDFPGDQKVLTALEADKTLADVERTLARFKVNYSRGANSLDSANVPSTVLNQIRALPAGEPFVIPAQGRVTVSVITGREPIPTTEQEAAPMAAQAMRQESLTKVLQTRLDEARTKADISYQDGLAPKKPGAGKTPS